MLMNDAWIRQQSLSNGMISPYYPEKIRVVSGERVVSYGTNSFGYDLTLGTEFRVYDGSGVLDAKDANTLTTKVAYANEYYDIAAGEMVLAVSSERFEIPEDVMCIVMGKSTYARLGILINVTPLEAGWHGTVTMEITNMNNRPVRLYVKEGIGQVLFYRGVPPSNQYIGNYNGQVGVTLPRVKHPKE